MRKTFALLGLLALALPVAGVAGSSAGEGTLSIENGQGRVMLQGRGGVIGRLERGSVTIFDLTPEDANDPAVFGDDSVRLVGETGIQYAGTGLRFRLVGGGFRIAINGKGIDLSVVAKGFGQIVAAQADDPGVYSLDGADCRNERYSCKPLPENPRRFQLGVERGEKNLVRPPAS